jgi:hypothetical protein
MENSMQEVETKKSEKLVPIDTSGEAVDVELKEEKVESVKKEEPTADTPIVEVQEEETTTPPVETKEEELEEYSVGVKKRIDKLTKKMREAERREQAAIDYAKQVKTESDKLKSTNIVQNESMLVDREKALVNQKEFAKRALEAAIQAQDVEKQVAANQEISRLTIEDERLKVSKAKALRLKAEAEKETPVDINKAIDQQAPTQVQEEAPKDPKAEAWAQKNDWFGTDNAMTYTAYDIHTDLVKNGVDPRDDEYYNEIDRRIRKEFPHKFEAKSKPTQKVASAVRTTSTGRRTVRLTPSQVAIAKKLGVPLEEYAKHVKEA